MPHDHSDHDAPDGHPHTLLPSDPALRVKALETILTQKGLIDPTALDKIIEAYETKIGPRNGARVVANAWTDPTFKAALLSDATSVVLELGYYGRQGEHMVVWKIQTRCTISSCVRCAAVTRGLCSASRLHGINQMLIALGLSENRAECWLNLA